MKNILLFGSSTETGKFIAKNYNTYFQNSNFYKFSRRKDQDIYLNLKSFIFPDELMVHEDTIVISLAPIWLFIPYLEKYLKLIDKKNIIGLFITSSTSTLTKRYSWNAFDKDLSKKLLYWENKLIKLKNLHNLNVSLIRPTLIYGDIGKKQDNNISFLLEIMRKSLIVPIPSETGLRQPIHYSQLGECILSLIKKNQAGELNSGKINIINIGGDEELTYHEILKRIKNYLPISDPANKCFTLKIPNRFFFLLFLPLLIFRPKFYEAIERIAINMNGFSKASEISGRIKRFFPVNLND